MKINVAESVATTIIKNHYRTIGAKGAAKTNKIHKDKLSQWGKKGGRPRKLSTAKRKKKLLTKPPTGL